MWHRKPAPEAFGVGLSIRIANTGMLRNFRKNPYYWLKRRGIFFRALAHIYRWIDFDRRLSDFIADPYVVLDNFIPPIFCSRVQSKSLVSIIIPVFNAAETIERCINSLLSQTHTNIQILVIDDASCDGSYEMVKGLALRDSRIFLFRNTRNLGVAAARNIGLYYAGGEYVSFQDADDFSAIDKIERQAAALDVNQERIIVTCNYVRLSENGERITLNGRRVRKSLVSAMFRREPVMRNVGFFRPLRVSEDTDYFRRIVSAFGRESELYLFRTLYFAQLRVGGLFLSSVDWRMESDVDYIYSPSSEVVANINGINSIAEEGDDAPVGLFWSIDVNSAAQICTDTCDSREIIESQI